MNLLASLLSLSSIVLLMAEAVSFHRKTSCRQDAWLKGTEALTSSLLKDSPEKEVFFLRKCSLLLIRREQKVTWGQGHTLELGLRGKL